MKFPRCIDGLMYRRVFRRVHRNLTETGTLIPHARAGHESRSATVVESVECRTR
jgi:hypothetical protein